MRSSSNLFRLPRRWCGPGPCSHNHAAQLATPSAPPEPADWHRTVHPGPALLFRFSALTFNAHRIDWDRRYCLQEEGYPGLVVHGPLTATLLVDLYLRPRPGAVVSSFSFRSLSPLFDTGPFTVQGRADGGGAALWALDGVGRVAMRATLA